VEKTDLAMSLKKLPFAEKIKLLSETEKAYVRGYIEKAVIDCQKSGAERQREKEKAGGEDFHG
jgi:hypothetical protein